MSKSNISTQKVVFLLLAVILIALTYFLIYQKNMDKVRLTEANITKLETRIGQLADMEVQVREMEKTSDAKKTETEEYISQFAPLTTYEKTVYQVYQMMTATDLRVSSIDFGNYFVFLQGGMLYGEGQAPEETTGNNANNNSQNTNNNNEQSSAAEIESTLEKNSEILDRITELTEYQKGPLNQVRGKVLTCSMGVSGSYRQCMKALDWVAGNREKMAVKAVSLAYDNSTGKLSGKFDVEFFELRGTGNAYIPPNISGFQYGIKNVFQSK